MAEQGEFQFSGDKDEFSYQVNVTDPSAKNAASAYLRVVQEMISEARLSNLEKDGEMSAEEFCAGVVTALVEAWDEARGDDGEGGVPLLETLEGMLEALKSDALLPTHVTRSGCDGQELAPKIGRDQERN